MKTLSNLNPVQLLAIVLIIPSLILIALNYKRKRTSGDSYVSGMKRRAVFLQISVFLFLLGIIFLITGTFFIKSM